MRGGLTVVLVFLACLVVAVLYIFLGRMQITKGINNLETRDATLQNQLSDIQRKEADIPRLKDRLPMWSKQLSMFEQAIPPELDDHIFFTNLARETDSRDLQILALDTTIGNPWLGTITEEMAVELEGHGINVNAARGIKVAFYSVTLVGDFDAILEVFENLKRYNRMYTLDMVAGPATAGSGTVAQILDPLHTPLNFSGKLYYGISEEEVSQETLAKVFAKAIAGPTARDIYNGVRNSAGTVEEQPEAGQAEEEPGDQASSLEGQNLELAASAAGGSGNNNQEGWLQ